MDAGLKEGPADGLALYVHIPFCETRCPYCDFNTHVGIEALIPRYVEALTGELAAWGRLLGRPPAKTVFFGGGTPSCLPPRHITALCATVREAFAVRDDAEFTLEVNPGDCDFGRLSDYAGAGVSRLSIGVQSFDDALLRTLGRRHDSAEAEQAILRAREAGFASVNLDLIFGLPGQSLDQWRASLERALAYGPEHLSLYGLTLEPGTPMEAWVRQGRMPEPDPDLAAEMYELAEDMLAQSGFRHYEISNWALPGHECSHNRAYWRMEPYLGVGAGAHSFLPGQRFSNAGSPEDYVDRLLPLRAPGSAAEPVTAMSEAGAVESVEETTPELLMADTMMMGLRLDSGVSRAAFRARFGLALDAAFGPVIEELSDAGLMESDQEGIRLTRRGRLLGNEVFTRFVSAAKEQRLPGFRGGLIGAGIERETGRKNSCGCSGTGVKMG